MMNPVAVLRVPTITPIFANSGGICNDKLKFSCISTTLLSVIGIKVNVLLLPSGIVTIFVLESKSIPFPV